MIGQAQLIADLQKTQAKSVLITGPKHWGKKTLLRELFKNEESIYEITGNAATFRESIEWIYQTARPTIYLIPDLDKCNQTVQNILLKVLEEPPKTARFFLTAGGPILPTIVSRCVSFQMQPYTEVQLGKLTVTPSLVGMFRSPGERDLINVPGIDEIISSLTVIKGTLESGVTLANLLKQVRGVNRAIGESGLTQDGFILIVQSMFGSGYSLDWLRQQPQDGVRYVRTSYFMQLWAERQLLQ